MKMNMIVSDVSWIFQVVNLARQSNAVNLTDRSSTLGKSLRTECTYCCTYRTICRGVPLNSFWWILIKVSISIQIFVSTVQSLKRIYKVKLDLKQRARRLDNSYYCSWEYWMKIIIRLCFTLGCTQCRNPSAGNGFLWQTFYWNLSLLVENYTKLLLRYWLIFCKAF